MTQDNLTPDPSAANPLYVGPAIDFQGYSLVPEVLSLDGQRRLRISDKNGNELFIPEEFLPALAQRGNHVQQVLRNTVDRLRQDFHNPAEHYPVVISGRAIVLPEEDPSTDGTPFIEWKTIGSGDRETPQNTHGWRLTLGGATTCTVGFATWNDLPGIANLVSMLSDPETCITMGSMIDPQPVQEMCSRIAARSLRSARAFPAVNLNKARKVLSNAAIPAGTGGNTDALLRLLTIKSGGKDVAVAVAVACPTEPVGTQTLSEEETRLTWNEKQKIIEDYRNATRQPWTNRARAAFIAAGWREVNLPVPRVGYYNSQPPVIWVTPIDAETWGSIAPAATREATHLSMTRGGRY